MSNNENLLGALKEIGDNEKAALSQEMNIQGNDLLQAVNQPQLNGLLASLYGVNSFTTSYRFDEHIVDNEVKAYNAKHQMEAYDNQIKELEESLTMEACGTKPPEFAPNTYGNAKSTAPEHTLILGKTTDDPQHKSLWGISQLDRTYHTHCLGSTGSGKSTFLRSLMVQDAWYGRGFLVMEPHGDLCDDILGEIPPYRLHNTVFLDVLTDNEFSPGFNPLQVPLNATKEDRASAVNRVSGLMAKHFHMDSGAVKLKKNLENALTALSYAPGCTILEVMSFYNDKRIQNTILKCMPEGAEKDRIKQAVQTVNPSDLGSLDNRISAFQNNIHMKRMFGQCRTTVDFYKLMNDGNIVIIPLRKGMTDDDSFRNFVGGYIISNVYHSSMRRAEIPQDERIIFSLYVDEFQNFLNGDFSGMLSEIRKYGVPILLANQVLEQLDAGTNAGLEQVGTRIYMNVTDKDAAALAHSMKEVTAIELSNVPKFHSVVQTLRNTQPQPPFLSSNLNIDAREKAWRNTSMSQRIAKLVKEISHTKYMTPITEIDYEIDRRNDILTHESKDTDDDNRYNEKLREKLYKEFFLKEKQEFMCDKSSAKQGNRNQG